METKTILSKWDSITMAIKEQAYFEQMCKEAGVICETLIVDSRDQDSIAEASVKFDLMLTLDGIFMLARVNDMTKLSMHIATKLDDLTEEATEIRNRQKGVL